MQHGSVRAVFGQVIGGAIVKTHADGKDHVRVMHGFVGFISPMHAEHTHALAMRAGEGPQPHQGTGDRQIQLLRQFQQLCVTGRVDRPATDVHNRFFGRQNGVQCPFDLPAVPLHRRVIGTHAHVLRIGVRHSHRRAHDVFRQIDHHRPRATG
ncbi:hypothetical protein D3C78_1350900 [compost metagenome]